MTEQVTQQDTTRVKAILYACQGMESTEEFDNGKFFRNIESRNVL